MSDATSTPKQTIQLIGAHSDYLQMDELFYLGKLSGDYNQTQVLSFKEGLLVQTRLFFNRKVSLSEVGRAFICVLRLVQALLGACFQVAIR